MKAPSFLTFLKIFGLSFALNFVWEHAHAVLYANYQGGPITEWVLFHATLGDAAILTALAVLFVFSHWWQKRLWLVIPIGIVIGIAIELYALNAGRWTYAPSMPIIPLLGTGLTPTLQLGILGYVTYLAIL